MSEETDLRNKSSYDKFVANRNFGFLKTFIKDQKSILQAVIFSSPNQDSGDGWFAIREQAIGGHVVLGAIEEFLLEDLNPEDEQNKQKETNK